MLRKKEGCLNPPLFRFQIFLLPTFQHIQDDFNAFKDFFVTFAYYGYKY